MKIWKNRSDSDADFNFKLGLSDTFYYDLNNATIKDQDSEISKYKDDIPILKGQVTNYHKKYQDEIYARKEEVNKVQESLDQLLNDAKQAQEAYKGENSRLQAKVDE